MGAEGKDRWRVVVGRTETVDVGKNVATEGQGYEGDGGDRRPYGEVWSECREFAKSGEAVSRGRNDLWSEGSM